MRQTLIKKKTEEREKKKKKKGEREAAPGAVRKYVSAALRRRRIDAPRAVARLAGRGRQSPLPRRALHTRLLAQAARQRLTAGGRGSSPRSV